MTIRTTAQLQSRYHQYFVKCFVDETTIGESWMAIIDKAQLHSLHSGSAYANLPIRPTSWIQLTLLPLTVNNSHCFILQVVFVKKELSAIPNIRSLEKVPVFPQSSR